MESIAPRSAHGRRDPRTTSIAPRTGATSSTATGPSRYSPTWNVASRPMPRERPPSTGAPVIASHQPDRAYPAAHGRLRTTAPMTTAAGTAAHRTDHWNLAPCSNVTVAHTAPSRTSVTRLPGSNAIITAQTRDAARNVRRHSVGARSPKESSSTSDARSTGTCPTSRRRWCAAHGKSAYVTRPPQRPDAMEAHASGTAAYARVAATRAARVVRTEAKRHTPSHPTSGAPTTRSICSRPMLPSSAAPPAAVRPTPVGTDPTWPKPAPHQPLANARSKARGPSSSPTICPTDDGPSVMMRRDPTSSTTTRTVQSTIAERGATSRAPAAVACACSMPRRRSRRRRYPTMCALPLTCSARISASDTVLVTLRRRAAISRTDSGTDTSARSSSTARRGEPVTRTTSACTTPTTSASTAVATRRRPDVSANTVASRTESLS